MASQEETVPLYGNALTMYHIFKQLSFSHGSGIKSEITTVQIRHSSHEILCCVAVFLVTFAGYVAGILVELYGNRVVTMTGTLLVALGFATTAFATHVSQLFVTYSLLTGNNV